MLLKRNTNKRMIFIPAIAVLIISSCTHTSFIDPSIHTITKECSPDTIYFQNEILPIIVSNCAKSGCHTAGGEEDAKNLSSYSAIMNSGYVKPFNSNDSKIIESVKGGDEKMPPPPDAPLTSTQIDLLEKWIDQGAFNNECEGGDCDTTSVTYSITISGIMATYCNGCHSGVSPSAGIDLTNYIGISAIAENGSLYGTIIHDPSYVAMPVGGNMLPDCKIDEIRIWIEGGYPNN